MDNKQPLLEGHPGHIKLLGADFGSPHIEWFPLFEVGKERNTTYPSEDVTLLFPVLEGHTFKCVLTH